MVRFDLKSKFGFFRGKRVGEWKEVEVEEEMVMSVVKLEVVIRGEEREKDR